jgi:integration host factor subunit beta
MTKSDLIQRVADRAKISSGKAEIIVNAIFDSMTASLVEGERIELRGFGVFEVRSYRGYEGRNPKTGVAVEVQPKRLPFFKVGKELRERVTASSHGPQE